MKVELVRMNQYNPRSENAHNVEITELCQKSRSENCAVSMLPATSGCTSRSTTPYGNSLTGNVLAGRRSSQGLFLMSIGGLLTTNQRATKTGDNSSNKTLHNISSYLVEIFVVIRASKFNLHNFYGLRKPGLAGTTETGADLTPHCACKTAGAQPSLHT